MEEAKGILMTIDREGKTNTHPHVALETFWLASQDKLSELFGERLAAALWVAKDMSPRDPVAKRAFEKVESFLSQRMEEGWKMRVRVDVSEKSELLSPLDALERGRAKGAAEALSIKTGHDDIDFTVERLLCNGARMEEIHGATLFKERIDALFRPEGFETLEPLYRSAKEPLKDLVAFLDDDLDKGVRRGMRHPYLASLAVGSLTLEIERPDGEKYEVPLLRRQASTDFIVLADRLRDEASSLCKEMADANLELRSRLLSIPDGWPDLKTFETTQAVAGRRFAGDNGLGHSDFYGGSWPSFAMQMEIHVESISIVEAKVDETVFPSRVNFASKRDVQKDEDVPAWMNPGKVSRL